MHHGGTFIRSDTTAVDFRGAQLAADPRPVPPDAGVTPLGVSVPTAFGAMLTAVSNMGPGPFHNLGLEGYIQEDVEVVVPEDAKLADHPVLRLYPIPEEKGFHVIGADRYVKVEPKPIHALGNNLKSLYGLQEPGSVSVDGSQLRFVYHGDLRQDQLMALDLSLHPLEFVKTAELVSVTTQEVPLNLYVADGEVPLRVERLKSRNDYLLSTDATLERGRVYAITTNGLLTPKDDADFRKIAPALRLA